MDYVIEIIYTIIESIMITSSIAMYFNVKPKFSQSADIFISFVLFCTFDILITVFSPPWIVTLFSMIFFLIGILEIFYMGTIFEHILISIISTVSLALIDVCVFTFLSWLLGVEYEELVTTSNTSRFLAVLITKLIYLIFIIIISSFKRKHIFMLNRMELYLISSTLIVSGILISIVRNVIYYTEEYYNAFLIILLCILLLNIGQYYMIICISKKNLKEKNMFLMQKQIEMQEESIRNLEVKYDETAKIRHDIKNYISCALELAEQGNSKDLIDYLKELSEEKINNIASYVKTKRKILSVVINSKLGMAERKGFDVQCIILNEMDNIKDTDISILLANLLDNAIEACDKNYGHSEIMLKMWSEAGYYCLKISNTIETDVLADNADLSTSKNNKDLHGIGLKSVKDIVEKYNGMINFRQKENVFYIYVSLEK